MTLSYRAHMASGSSEQELPSVALKHRRGPAMVGTPCIGLPGGTVEVGLGRLSVSQMKRDVTRERTRTPEGGS